MSATSLRKFAPYRLVLFFGCVFFAFLKYSGVPTVAAVAESLPNMQQSVSTERYLDDTSSIIPLHASLNVFVWGLLLHPATLRGRPHASQQLYCLVGLVLQRPNTLTVSCSADGNCGWRSLLNGNRQILGQLCAPLLSIHCAHHYTHTRFCLRPCLVESCHAHIQQ